MIHEICHSSAPGHNEHFFARMFKAADRAEKIGWSKVASLIRKEVDCYAHSPKVTASTIYMSIEDCLFDIPDASYKNVIKLVARRFGMYPEEMKKKYKRCREAYATAIRHLQEEQKIREKCLRRVEMKKREHE